MSSALQLPEKEIDQFLHKHFNYEYDQIKRQSVPVLGSLSQLFLESRPMLILLLGVILVVYANAIQNGFVSDDLPTIVDNKNIGQIAYAFRNFQGLLRDISVYLVYSVFGLNAAAFRSFNLLFHIGSVWLVFLIAYQMKGKKPFALFVSLLFAVHPVMIESIVWISGGPYSQSAFFTLSAFLLYLYGRESKKYYYLSLVFFVLAFFASEKTIIFPLILFVYELALGNLKEKWKFLVPFFSVAFVFAIVVLGNLADRKTSLQVDYYQATGMINPVLQVPVSLGSYLKLLIWPDELSIYQTELKFSYFSYAIFILISIAYLSVLLYCFKKNRLIFFWLAFMVISLLPTMTPLGVSWIFAERYAYLGSIGFLFSAAYLLNWVYEKDRFKKPATVAFVIIILALSVRTIIRNSDWKNEDTLWLATVKTSPSSHNIHNNLGDVYARRGDNDKALEEFLRATEIHPRYADAYHNLANTYRAMDKPNDAIFYYEKAISINPRLWQSHSGLAEIYFGRGEKEKALEHLKQAIEIRPDDENLKKNFQVVEEAVKKL